MRGLAATVILNAYLVLVPAIARAADRDGEIPSEPGTLPLGVCLVPEFGYVPELTWDARREPLDDEDARAVEREWKTTWGPRVAGSLTVEVVRKMVMPRDRVGMSNYTKLELLKNVKWTPVAQYENHVVVEATLAHLPRISAIRRWLHAYCIFNRKSAKVVRATIMVRGSRDE